jgi:hypothetical protein
MTHQELRDLYRSPSIVRKHRRLWWAGNVVRMGKVRYAYRIFMGKLLENFHLKDWEGGWRITLKWILRKQVVRISSAQNWLRIVSSYVLWYKQYCSVSAARVSITCGSVMGFYRNNIKFTIECKTISVEKDTKTCFKNHISQLTFLYLYYFMFWILCAHDLCI